jgi:hypothetical protein
VLSDPEKRRAYNRSHVSFDTTRTSNLRPPARSSAQTPYRSLTRYATTEVAEPALGLAVSTAMVIPLQYLAFFDVLLRVDGGAAEVPVVCSGGLGIFSNLIGCILGTVVLFGAIRMRNLENYRFAVAASILATVSCFSPWFLLGLPFGVWALVVLRKGQVQDAFWS